MSASSSSRPVATWTAAWPARNVSAISAKFCMCGPNTIGLPNTAGSRMLCPPMSHEAAADEHDGRHLVDLRQFADRVEHDDVGLSSSSMASSERRAVRNPDCRASAAASAKCSGWRGARMSSGLRARVRMRSNARSTISCSPGIVLPATMTARPSATRKKRSTRSAPPRRAGARRATCRASNFRLPVTVMRSRGRAELDQPAGRLLALHAEAVDEREHAPEERPDEAVARETTARRSGR